MKKTYNFLAAALLLCCFSVQSFAQTVTYPFSYTGAVQTWTVPTGVSSLSLTVKGAKGGVNSIGTFLGCPTIAGTLVDREGYGACVVCTLAVTPGQILNIYVGGKGGDATIIPCATSTGGAGGYNGGGAGQTFFSFGTTVFSGGGGGGATDIRVGGTALANRVIVAAGGGGGGANTYSVTDAERGGDGGGTTGEDGFGGSSPASSAPFAGGGYGGTSGGGGSGGSISTYPTGSSGTSGVGGNAATTTPGGGGGGGYYGGGGGSFGGGGGGSSYTDAVLTSSITHTRGCNSTGNGSVSICVIDAGIISGPSGVCPGGAITLAETMPGGVWSSGSTAIASISPTGVVTGVTPGTATISYTLSSACGNGSALYTVTVYTLPVIAGTTSICLGSTTALTATPAGGNWISSTPSVAIIGSSSGLATGIILGTTTIIYTDPRGCIKPQVFTVRDIVGRTTVCKDSSITLSVPGFGGLTWSSAATAIASVGTGSGIVTGLSVGTAVISYSGTGCALAKVITVGAYAPIAGRDSVCVGGSGYLTNIVGGGTWSSSATTIASVSSDSGLVYGYVAGIVTINYRLPAGCWASTSLRVIDNPPPIGGTLQMCPDATTLLSDAVTGGTWSSANNSIATVTAGTGIVRGISADTTTIYYTIQPGCRTGITVTVNPLPAVITANRDIECPGVMDTLHTASRGGTWGSTTASIATVDTGGVITTLTGGVATFNYTLPTGCLRTMTLTVRPAPQPTVSYNWLYNTFYTPDIYPSYQWYDSAQGLIPGATSPSLAALENEYYWVVVTDNNGCKGPSSRIYFNTHMLGVSHVQQAAVKVYPNPATETVSIECAVRVKAVLSTIDGRMLIQQADAKSLDVSRLASGVYMLAVYDDSGEILTVQKVVKE